MNAVTVSFSQIQTLPPDSQERREAVRTYLRQFPNLRKNAALRAGVDPSRISQILHGATMTQAVAKAIQDEERAIMQPSGKGARSK